MRKLLLGFGLVALLSACSSTDEPVAEAAPDTSEQSLVESEVVAEPEEEIVVEPEPVAEPEKLDEGSVVESKSAEMDFSTCMLQQAEFSDAISSSGNYKVIPIVDTNVLSIVRLCANDGSVIHTCSAPDNKVVITRSTNREGC